jgi:hypothetical protein
MGTTVACYSKKEVVFESIKRDVIYNLECEIEEYILIFH